MKRKIIKNEKGDLERLVGQRILQITREGDLCKIRFIPRKRKRRRARNIKISELCLEGEWRILDIRRSKIVVGSWDIYEPGWSKRFVPNFDWESPGGTLFDKRVKKMTRRIRPIVVKKIHRTESGDLRLILSNHCVLEWFYKKGRWRGEHIRGASETDDR